MFGLPITFGLVCGIIIWLILRTRRYEKDYYSISKKLKYIETLAGQSYERAGKNDVRLDNVEFQIKQIKEK